MPGKLLSFALNRTLREIRHVTPVPPARATGQVAEVYADSTARFGMLAPPVALHSPAPVPLAAAWLLLRETLVNPSSTPRALKEEVAEAISTTNSCPYCVSVHTLMHTAFTSAEAETDRTPGDPRGHAPGDAVGDAAGAETGRTPGDSRGHVAGDAVGGEAGVGAVAAWVRGAGPPPGADLAELLGVAFTFHYLNRMVSVFLPDSPLPSEVPSFAHGMMRGILARLAVRASPSPGGPALLPEAEHPADLVWAAPAPRVADAVARAVRAVGAEAETVLSPEARALVEDQIALRDAPPMPRSWAAEAVAQLPPTERPAARLALLIALDAPRVTPADVTAPALPDHHLITLASWSSLTAARHHTTLLATTPEPTRPHPQTTT
ncbi:carboxymuconolactone decarboxylase family protein [Actinocorallia sp. A-T 12471]|uniref:carboxymuconolactone decarboxylase family protein n=1 Tax=Actinocorallia sp. A-T 12471 TaxID=3089813 RepID=UPI0029CC488C|nr:carboxymuconolactone decarboxylase family protein [Actinocorallia sp. A-T 12471]MDX6741619.1 carboxymuconolactone decarboxylase family protein [Actinocorallia sp. A-T 12471]